MKKWNLTLTRKSSKEPNKNLADLYRSEIRETKMTVSNLFSKNRNLPLTNNIRIEFENK